MDVFSLVPAFGGLIVTLSAFFVALSVIVAVHEYGHYIVGRWSGIEADVFSLGFGPVIVSRVDRRGTRWQFALIPFGGYVKFKGDKDAASGTDSDRLSHLDEKQLRQTMHGAPLWARTATVAAGPVFNFALSLILFSAIALWQGQVRSPLSIGSLYEIPYAHQMQVGDIVLAIDGQTVPDFADVTALSSFWSNLSDAETYEFIIRRNEQELALPGPNINIARVSAVVPRSAAAQADLRSGDVITRIDGASILTFDSLKQAVEGSAGETLAVEVWREGATRQLSLTPRRVDEQTDEGFSAQWRIGVMGGGFFFEPQTSTLPFASAVTSGADATWRVMKGSLSGFYHVVTGAISSCNLSGPIGIAETSGQMARQGGDSFIWFIAVLSAAVGLINLFPVPVLDGGHLVFFAFEAVIGRPPSAYALNILMTIGLALVLGFMVFALGNDLLCP